MVGPPLQFNGLTVESSLYLKNKQTWIMIFFVCCCIVKHGDPCKVNECRAGSCVLTVIENTMGFQCNCPEDRTGQLCEGTFISNGSITLEIYPTIAIAWTSSNCWVLACTVLSVGIDFCNWSSYCKYNARNDSCKVLSMQSQ